MVRPGESSDQSRGSRELHALVGAERHHPDSKADEDCSQLLFELEGFKREIICNDDGFCQGLYWDDEDNLVVDDVTSRPVSCDKAADWLSNKSLMNEVYHHLPDVIDATLEFPRQRPSIVDLSEISYYIEKYDFSYFDDGDREVLQRLGGGIEIMLATIHNLGGMERANKESENDHMDRFVSCSIGLIEEFQNQLSSDDNPCEFFTPDRDDRDLKAILDDIEAFFDVSHTTETQVPTIGNITNVEELLQALNAASDGEEGEYICKNNTWILDPGNSNDPSHLRIRAAYICRAYLPIELRTRITKELLRSKVGFIDDENALTINLNQIRDAQSFFVASTKALGEFDKIDFARHPLPMSVSFSDPGLPGVDWTIQHWLFCLSRYIFDPANGYFEITGVVGPVFGPTPQSASGNRYYMNRRKTYRQIGRILGLCWKHNQGVGVLLSATLVGFLSTAHIKPEDMARWLFADNPATSVTVNSDQMLREKTIGRIETELEEIERGFYEVVPYPTLEFFSMNEITRRFLGQPTIDTHQR